MIGVNHDVILRKLLAQEDDLDLGKAVKIAQACMTTAENLKEILSKSQNSSSADTVNKIAQSSYKATPKPVVCLKPASSVARGPKNLCWRCGANHMAHQCRFKRYTCNGCGKIRHLQKRCSQSSSGDSTGTTHHVDDGEHVAGADESSLHGEEYEMYTIHGNTAPIT